MGMGRAKESADRIRSEIPIVRVLHDYGYSVDPDGADREQQFSCDLHGDGSDGKPSARAYPGSSSFHCFACGRSRDAITLVREKEGLEFWPAIRKLESDYGLPPLPWSDDSQSEPKISTAKKLESSLLAGKTLSVDQKFARVSSLIGNAYAENQLSPSDCAALWAKYDKVGHYRREETHQTQVLSGLLDALFDQTFRIIRNEES